MLKHNILKILKFFLKTLNHRTFSSKNWSDPLHNGPYGLFILFELLQNVPVKTFAVSYINVLYTDHLVAPHLDLYLHF